MPVSKYFQHVGQKKIQNLIGNKSVNAELHKSDPELSSKMWISEHQYKTSVPAIDTITLKDLKATFCHCITISLVYRVSQKEVSFFDFGHNLIFWTISENHVDLDIFGQFWTVWTVLDTLRHFWIGFPPEVSFGTWLDASMH